MFGYREKLDCILRGTVLTPETPLETGALITTKTANLELYSVIEGADNPEAALLRQINPSDFRPLVKDKDLVDNAGQPVPVSICSLIY